MAFKLENLVVFDCLASECPPPSNRITQHGSWSDEQLVRLQAQLEQEIYQTPQPPRTSEEADAAEARLESALVEVRKIKARLSNR